MIKNNNNETLFDGPISVSSHLPERSGEHHLENVLLKAGRCTAEVSKLLIAQALVFRDKSIPEAHWLAGLSAAEF